MTSTQVRVLLVATLTALGLFAWANYVLPLGARALPAILLIAGIYLVTRPISSAWQDLGPHPVIVVGSVPFQAFVVLWVIAAIAFAMRSFVTGEPPIFAGSETRVLLFFSLTAPFWWGFGCALAMLFKRAA